MSFQIGDSVRLRSGGPLMTVTGVTDGGWLICTWFKERHVETSSFPPPALEKV